MDQSVDLKQGISFENNIGLEDVHVGENYSIVKDVYADKGEAAVQGTTRLTYQQGQEIWLGKVNTIIEV